MQVLEREEGVETPVVHPPVKEAHTRLLDLLAGWSEFIQRDGVPDDPSVVDRACELYQEAGNMNDTSPEAVEAFIRDRVIRAVVIH